MKEKIKSIQALRAVAFTCIALSHFTSNKVPLGFYGVSIFIVLSGFLMVIAYWDRTINISIKDNIIYALKKIKRLYPLHVVTTIAYLMGCVLVYIKNKEEIVRFVNLCIKAIINFTLLQSWYPDNNISMSLNGVAWYLSTTVFLYFVFPWILRLIKRNSFIRNMFLGIMCILLQIAFSVIVANISLNQDFFHWATYTFPIYRLGDFTIGCLLGAFYVKKNEINLSEHVSTLCEFFIIALSILIVRLQTQENLVGIQRILLNATLPYILISVVIIILFTTNKGILTNLLSNKYIIFIGDISPYAFLTHYVIDFYLISIVGFLNIEFVGIYDVFFVIIKYFVTIFITWAFLRIFRIRFR